MKVVTVSKNLLNPVALPGMGQSIELPELDTVEAQGIRTAFSRQELFVEFNEEPGQHVQVKQLWSNPHSTQVTLFV